MNRFQYPVLLTAAHGGGYVVTCRDLPQLITQGELYPSDIDRFVVPLLDADKQKAIGDLVRESLVNQQHSRQLLEQAKTRVEQLIEEAVQP